VRISDVADRVIGHLSKGYRQRVGLADVLTHDPEILILDEPTVGLDPNQVREVRDLIKEQELGRDRTVLFSTHIIPWVEEVCSRAIVIARGRVVAEGTVAALAGRLEGCTLLLVRAESPGAEVAALVRAAPGLRALENLSLDDGRGTNLRCLVDLGGAAAIEASLRERFGAAGLSILRAPPRLEDAFHEATRGLGGQEAEGGAAPAGEAA
jgi:ABC-2 type transport system ATP-binding protein